MSTKNVYLIIKSTYRFDKLIFRDVIYIGSSIGDVYGKLFDMLNIVYLDSKPNIYFDHSGKWIMLSNYHSSKVEDLHKSDMYQFFKMNMGGFVCKQIYFTPEMIDNIKLEFYGR